MHKSLSGLLLAASALALAACGTTAPSGPAATFAPPGPAGGAIAITNAELVGRWGLAAYTTDAGIEKTRAEARNACSNPYIMTAGPGGGTMSYLADQTVQSELVVKPGPGGRMYFGLPGPAGNPRDREIIGYGGGYVTMVWVDPAVARRYGTMVFYRCA